MVYIYRLRLWYRLRCGAVDSVAILVNRITHGTIVQVRITTVLQKKKNNNKHFKALHGMIEICKILWFQYCSHLIQCSVLYTVERL